MNIKPINLHKMKQQHQKVFENNVNSMMSIKVKDVYGLLHRTNFCFHQTSNINYHRLSLLQHKLTTVCIKSVLAL